ncbi:MAG: hypothetical protein ACRBN8_41030 [Nannocystales bacterium]
MFKPTLLLTLVVALAACDAGAPDHESDGADDSFLAGPKADGALIAEGTPEALGVLALVNEASHAVLDDDVGLDVRAASNIVDHRETPDPFDDLAELDAIPYVGPVALQRLLAYAEANGYVPDPEPDADDLSEGSDLALAVLDLVNTADFETLDDDVALDRRAATNIVEHREGPDPDSPADDDPIETIAELDGIGHVGAVALAKLVAYAQDHGYVDPQLDAGDYELWGCGFGYDQGRTTRLRSAAGRLFIMESGDAFPVADDGTFSVVTSDNCGASQTVSGSVVVARDSVELEFHRRTTYYSCSGTHRTQQRNTIVQSAYSSFDRSSETSAPCSVTSRNVQLAGTVEHSGETSDFDEWVILKTFRDQRAITWRLGQPTLQWFENVPVDEAGDFDTYFYSSPDQIHFFNGTVDDGLIELAFGTGNYATNTWIRWDMTGFYNPSWF